MSAAFYITAEGLVCAGTRLKIDIDSAILRFSELLNGKSEGKFHQDLFDPATLLLAATFNALFQGMPVKWTLQDDIVNPFGDKREALVTVYTFDLDKDILLFSSANQTLQLPLCRFREDRPVSLNEFTVFEPPSPPSLDPLPFPSPHWTPSYPLPSHSLPFVTRIFSDFAHQWRHILRRHYTDSTFRKLARAVLCLARLDFKVVEIASRWIHTCERGPFVSIHDLPSWQPFEEHFIRIGRTAVVLNQDLEHAMALVRKDVAEKNENKETIRVAGLRQNNYYDTYLLLSVRHIALCRINNQGVLLYTSPATFLNGVDAPSSAAIALLLRAFLFAFPRPRTWIHNFPIEIQDQILEYTSEGSIEAARIGSLLELGSPFRWIRAKDTSRRGGHIERHESHTHRSGATPVESQIWFETFSRVAYR